MVKLASTSSENFYDFKIFNQFNQKYNFLTSKTLESIIKRYPSSTETVNNLLNIFLKEILQLIIFQYQNFDEMSNIKIKKEIERNLLEVKAFIDKINLYFCNENIHFGELKNKIKELSEHLIFRGDYLYIEKYILKNRHLIPFLEQIPLRILEFFPSSKLYLELVTDPEERNEEELFIYIKTSLNPRKALEKLEDFDKNWFIDACLTYDADICVNLEFE